MEQFSLEKYLENPSRKVVTRRGNPVRIICTDRKHGEDNLPIVFLEENNGGEFLLTCRNDGRCDNYDTLYDLFFADKEEELTELQKTLEEDCDCYVNLYNDGKTREELREWIKCWCNSIIDLARKKLENNDWRQSLRSYKDVYEQGKQDALKDLPKWKKITKREQNYLAYGYLSNDEYYLSVKELIEKLPKEETESTSFINQETFNSAKRTGYIVGYNQAMKDFLEKAEEFLYLQLNNGLIECGNIERLIDDFKNYMSDEM